MKNPHALVLETKPYAKDSTWKSWWCILSTTILLVLASAETLLDIPLVLKVVCSVLAGLLSLRLFVIYHDQQHHAILPNSKLAEFLMRLVGLWALSPSSIWRSSHNHHHKHNSKLKGSNIGSYPIMTKEQFLKSTRSERAYYLFMRHPLTILFGYVTVFLYGMAIYPFFNSPKEHFDCLISLLLHIAVAVLVTIFFGWTGLILALLIPRFIACAMGSYLFYAQHNFPGVCFKDKAGWTYEIAALQSSSYLKTSAIMGWFTANIGYHHIHHLNHRVPFYRLPEAFKKVPALQTPRTTSLNPLDIIRCLRLKVWDVEAQKMVGL